MIPLDTKGELGVFHGAQHDFLIPSVPTAECHANRLLIVIKFLIVPNGELERPRVRIASDVVLVPGKRHQGTAPHFPNGGNGAFVIEAREQMFLSVRIGEKTRQSSEVELKFAKNLTGEEPIS